MRKLAIVTTVLVLTGAAAFAYTRVFKDDDRVEPTLLKKSKKKPLKISGHADHLVPGVTTIYEVKIRNNLKHRVKMRSVKAKVGDASAVCPRSLVRAKKVRTTKALRARRTRRVQMEVTLLPEAPDVCQGAKFPVRYKARFRLRPHAH